MLTTKWPLILGCIALRLNSTHAAVFFTCPMSMTRNYSSYMDQRLRCIMGCILYACLVEFLEKMSEEIPEG